MTFARRYVYYNWSRLKNILFRQADCIKCYVGSNGQMKQNILAQLGDEINRLKGEQGKPDIKPTKKENQDYSSESERKKRKRHKKKKSKSKKHKIKIDREEICKIDKSRTIIIKR